ncbi:hypothetical protein ACVWZ3_009984 [Bradyrhizobium sp. i1.3.6]
MTLKLDLRLRPAPARLKPRPASPDDLKARLKVTRFANYQPSRKTAPIGGVPCAGHGVAITEAGGCLQCQIGRTGAPSFKVVDWPEGADANQEEPACGAHYQPYGPIELSYVTAMLSELALDCLLQPPEHSFSRVFVTSENRIANLGGRLSELWKSTYGEENTGVRIVDRPWLRTECAACGGARADEAA